MAGRGGCEEAGTDAPVSDAGGQGSASGGSKKETNNTGRS